MNAYSEWREIWRMISYLTGRNFLHIKQAVKAKYMTIIKPKDNENSSGNLICARCSASLPPHAKFCSSCGEMIGKKKDEEGKALTDKDNAHIQEQKVDDTVRIPPRLRGYLKGLQSYQSHKNNEITVRTYKCDSLLQDVEAPPFDRLS